MLVDGKDVPHVGSHTYVVVGGLESGLIVGGDVNGVEGK